MAAEDRRFFEHRGIDPQGIFRALVANYQKGSIRQGGSTITQQLVKNTFLSPEKSISRKFSEAFLSLALERRMSKEEIFTLYCNEIYLGQYGLTGIHGVEAEITPAIYENTGNRENDQTDFKEVNGLPSEKSKTIEQNSAEPEINKTYIEDFENQNPKSAKEKLTNIKKN